VGVFDIVLEAIIGWFTAGSPESRWARIVATIVCIAGIVATCVVIYLALAGSL
jgi:hypothetical protein